MLDKIKETLGKYKLLYGRLTSYIGIVNFLMILYMFAKNEPLGFNWSIWLLIVGILCILILVFDVYLVIEADSNYGFSKTPKFVEMDKKLDKIIEMLNDSK